MGWLDFPQIPDIPEVVNDIMEVVDAGADAVHEVVDAGADAVHEVVDAGTDAVHEVVDAGTDTAKKFKDTADEVKDIFQSYISSLGSSDTCPSGGSDLGPPPDGDPGAEEGDGCEQDVWNSIVSDC